MQLIDLSQEIYDGQQSHFRVTVRDFFTYADTALRQQPPAEGNVRPLDVATFRAALAADGHTLRRGDIVLVQLMRDTLHLLNCRQHCAAVVSGAFSSFRSSIMSTIHCDCNYVPGILQYAEMSDV